MTLKGLNGWNCPPLLFRETVSVERSIINGTLQCGEAPPSAVWSCGKMSILHKLWPTPRSLVSLAGHRTFQRNAPGKVGTRPGGVLRVQADHVRV